MNPLVLLSLGIVAATLSVARLPAAWYGWMGLWQPQWLLLFLMYLAFLSSESGCGIRPLSFLQQPHVFSIILSIVLKNG